MRMLQQFWTENKSSIPIRVRSYSKLCIIHTAKNCSTYSEICSKNENKTHTKEELCFAIISFSMFRDFSKKKKIFSY